jgi:hypothetical protein
MTLNIPNGYAAIFQKPRISVEGLVATLDVNVKKKMAVGN